MQFIRYVPMFRRNCCLHLQGRIKSVCPLNTYLCYPFHKQSKGKSIVWRPLTDRHSKGARNTQVLPCSYISRGTSELFQTFSHDFCRAVSHLRSLTIFLTKECGKPNAFSLRCMQRITMTSCQSDRCSATSNTPRVLCNSNPHYRIHSIPPLERWLSQMNPIHIPT